MLLKKYSKIKRLGSSEVENIFARDEETIVVEEKLDGSNFRFWLEGGKLKFGSRRVNGVGSEQWEKIIQYLRENINRENLKKDVIYIGEAMRKHTINYNFDKIPKFIGYDVLEKKTGKPLNINESIELFHQINLEFVEILFEGKVKEWFKEDIQQYLETSAYYDGKPEGIVIKNYNRLNKYNRPLFAKKVTERFTEKKSKSDNTNHKPSKKNTEYIIEKYVTKARVRKIINKLTLEEGEKLERSLMQKLIPHVSEDVLQEEILEIYSDSKVKKIDFRIFSQLIPKKCIKVLDTMIEERQKV